MHLRLFAGNRQNYGNGDEIKNKKEEGFLSPQSLNSKLNFGQKREELCVKKQNWDVEIKRVLLLKGELKMGGVEFGRRNPQTNKRAYPFADFFNCFCFLICFQPSVDGFYLVQMQCIKS